MDKKKIEEIAIIMLDYGMETYTNEDFLSSMEIRQRCYPIFRDYAKRLVEKGYEKQKQGRWIYSNMGCVINCSNCGERLELCYPDGTEIRETAYCPFCGAKMDKQRDLTGGMRCRPIRVEVQNLVYLMGEWAIENNMCWNDEHAKNLAYYLLDKKYRKESDTAREILQAVDNESNGQTVAVTNVLRKRYGVKPTEDK